MTRERRFKILKHVNINTMGTQVRERSLGRLGADGMVSETHVTSDHTVCDQGG